MGHTLDPSPQPYVLVCMPGQLLSLFDMGVSTLEGWQGQPVALGALRTGLLMVCCGPGTLQSFLGVCFFSTRR